MTKNEPSIPTLQEILKRIQDFLSGVYKGPTKCNLVEKNNALQEVPASLRHIVSTDDKLFKNAAILPTFNFHIYRELIYQLVKEKFVQNAAASSVPAVKQKVNDIISAAKLNDLLLKYYLMSRLQESEIVGNRTKSTLKLQECAQWVLPFYHTNNHYTIAVICFLKPKEVNGARSIKVKYYDSLAKPLNQQFIDQLKDLFYNDLGFSIEFEANFVKEDADEAHRSTIYSLCAAIDFLYYPSANKDKTHAWLAGIRNNNLYAGLMNKLEMMWSLALNKQGSFSLNAYLSNFRSNANTNDNAILPSFISNDYPSKATIQQKYRELLEVFSKHVRGLDTSNDLHKQLQEFYKTISSFRNELQHSCNQDEIIELLFWQSAIRDSFFQVTKSLNVPQFKWHELLPLERKKFKWHKLLPSKRQILIGVGLSIFIYLATPSLIIASGMISSVISAEFLLTLILGVVAFLAGLKLTTKLTDADNSSSEPHFNSLIAPAIFEKDEEIFFKTQYDLFEKHSNTYLPTNSLSTYSPSSFHQVLSDPEIHKHYPNQHEAKKGKRGR